MYIEACFSIQFIVVRDLLSTGWSSADWSSLYAEEIKLLPWVKSLIMLLC